MIPGIAIRIEFQAWLCLKVMLLTRVRYIFTLARHTTQSGINDQSCARHA